MSSVQVRVATAADAPHVLRLAPCWECPLLPVRGVPTEARQQQRLEKFHTHRRVIGTHPDVRFILGEQDGTVAGYVMLVLGTRESITNEPLGLLQELVVEQREQYPVLMPAMLAEAEALARQAGVEYLAAEVYPEATHHEAALGALGYWVDINRMVKRVPPDDTASLPEGAQAYRVRASRETDRIFIMELNARSCIHTLPAGHVVDPDFLMERYMDAYLLLPMTEDETHCILIAETIESQEPVGFLILKTGFCDDVSREPVAYVYDIEVKPEHWGGSVSQLLIREGEAYLRRRHIPLLTSDISNANPRPLVRSIKSLGFQIEWRRWVKSLK
ncbi:MAG: GNAT family N-acetyltransferase [Candidatus Xenobia bacterium]